jgi:branched-chain amino acid transport system ATP-binding protein
LANSISVENLCAGYGSVQVLDGITLAANDGETVTLLGTNGNGKSTLMKCIMGIVRPTSGKVRAVIDGVGHDLVGRSPEDIVDLGIALVPEGRRLFPRLSVEENLLLGAFRKTARKAIAKNLEFCFETFPVLAERRRQLAGSMSGGEQQMLTLARALMTAPKILLVDEPSVGLSPTAIGIVFDELLRINAAGQTILLVEQNTKKAMAVAQRAVILRLGKVIWDGRPADITHDELGELFLTGRMRGETDVEH